MSTALKIQERRSEPRFEVSLNARDAKGRRLVADDLSVGGTCLVGDAVEDFEVGQEVELEIDVPGHAMAFRTRGEVRWIAGAKRCGIRFTKAARRTAAVALAAVMAMAPGIASANESVPTFDPDADQIINVSGSHGQGTRPDEYALQNALETQYTAIDMCVDAAKDSKVKVEGDATVQILLNPQGARPLGVNASLDEGANVQLVECIRQATAKAPFPAYDGPPVIAEMSFELDPGTVELD